MRILKIKKHSRRRSEKGKIALIVVAAVARKKSMPESVRNARARVVNAFSQFCPATGSRSVKLKEQ